MKGKDSLKDAIYNAILESIISQEYRPNQVLNEKTLVEKYGCSKSPVREALVSLCNDNVLRNIPRYGYEVVRLTVEDIQEMLQFRLVLEGGLLSANCENSVRPSWTVWSKSTRPAEAPRTTSGRIGLLIRNFTCG